MAKLTRRGFIKKTSVGAATLGALVAVPRLAEVEAAPQPHAAGGPTAGHHEPLLAHVRNRASGEIAPGTGDSPLGNAGGFHFEALPSQMGRGGGP